MYSVMKFILLRTKTLLYSSQAIFMSKVITMGVMYCVLN